jgi:hypothetical protein
MLTPDDFRARALSMEGAFEGAHMGHPDFRANGRIFATLYPDGEWGMVKLGLEEQQDFIDLDPATFVPAKGAWGLQGCTTVCLARAEPAAVRKAMQLAWQQTVAKRPSGWTKSKATKKSATKAARPTKQAAPKKKAAAPRARRTR